MQSGLYYLDLCGLCGFNGHWVRVEQPDCVAPLCCLLGLAEQSKPCVSGGTGWRHGNMSSGMLLRVYKHMFLLTELGTVWAGDLFARRAARGSGACKVSLVWLTGHVFLSQQCILVSWKKKNSLLHGQFFILYLFNNTL